MLSRQVVHRHAQDTRPDDTIDFAYDAAGNLERIADGDSEIVYTYDALNRALTETATLAGSAALVLTHAYDPDFGDRTSVTDSLGGSTVFTYDAVSRLDTVTSAAGPVVDLDWDDDGRLAGIAYPNGVTATYAYDPARGLLDTLTHADAGGPLLTATYGYEATGRIDSIIEAGQARSFAYDGLGRVTAAGTVGLPESYSYDIVGNRESSHLSASHVHDDADRLLADATHTYTYDLNGNLRTATETATGAVTTYTYDALDRLTGADLPGGGSTATYRYDALGRRFEKDTGGVVTRYVHDGPDILIEQDGAGAVAARYAHGALVDQPLAMHRGGTDAFYLADHQGSIRFLLDDTGATLNQYAYDAFGNSLVATESIANPFTYTAREQDPETGNLHYRARSYSPRMGRFLSPVRIAALDEGGGRGFGHGR